MVEIVPPASMMCALCHAVLTPTADFTYAAGSDEPTGITNVEYHHPVGFRFDHPPMPVPPVGNQLSELCDWCSAQEVAGYALATPFEIVMPGSTTMHYDDGQWACCSTCRELIEAGEYDALTARSVTIMEARHGGDAGLSVRTQHAAFFRAYLGVVHDDPQVLG